MTEGLLEVQGIERQSHRCSLHTLSSSSPTPRLTPVPSHVLLTTLSPKKGLPRPLLPGLPLPGLLLVYDRMSPQGLVPSDRLSAKTRALEPTQG